MTARPFLAYQRRRESWYLHCRVCETNEYIGPSPDRAHDHAETHALWWHSYALPIRFMTGI